MGLRPSLAGTTDSNLAGDMDVSLSCDSSVLSGRGTCVGLVTNLESFFECGVFEVDCETSIFEEALVH